MKVKVSKRVAKKNDVDYAHLILKDAAKGCIKKGPSEKEIHCSIYVGDNIEVLRSFYLNDSRESEYKMIRAFLNMLKIKTSARMANKGKYYEKRIPLDNGRILFVKFFFDKEMM